MKPDVEKLFSVWQENGVISKQKTNLPPLNLEEIVGNVFTAGPSYYYLINFHDMSLSHVSESIKEIHGFEPMNLSISDILNCIHPDDMEHVSKAETFSGNFFINNKIINKVHFYKICYAFRFKITDGTFKLFLHQALTLTYDENFKSAIALNIHTDISHLTTENNKKVSFIGLYGEPSYMNLNYENPLPFETEKFTLSKREREIVYLLSEGIDSKQIAQQLNISNETVRNHRKNILKKINCTNTAQLIKKCMLMGLI